jgi:hypothetical protein
VAILALAIAAGCTPVPAPAPPPPPPPPAPTPEAPVELKELRDRIRRLLEESETLVRNAHTALDAGRYDEAAELHRNGVAAREAAGNLRAAEEGLVRAALRRHLEELDHEEIKVRDGAMRELVGLGAPPELLREMAKGRPPEVARRLDQLLNRRQWASGASASTEYSTSNWCAAQATGPPNTEGAGDFSTAWASREPDADTEWLILTFDAAVEPGLIRIHETYNAGAVAKVETRDDRGAWRTVWEGAAAAAPAPRWLEIPVPAGAWTTREVRLTLDSNAVPGWNEIDAVELVGALR